MKLNLTFSNFDDKRTSSLEKLDQVLSSELSKKIDAREKKAQTKNQPVVNSAKPSNKKSGSYKLTPGRTQGKGQASSTAKKAAGRKAITRKAGSKASGAVRLTNKSEKQLETTRQSSANRVQPMTQTQRKAEVRREKNKILKSLQDTERVGVWDLTGYLGFLGNLLAELNKAQKNFLFFPIDAAAPVDFVSKRERIENWLIRQGRDPEIAAKITQNIIAEEFYAFSANIREKLELHVLAGIVPCMITDIAYGEVLWNLFYSWTNDFVILSITDLFEYAAAASRPVEAVVASLMVSAVLQERVDKELVHENTGCIFDFNCDRADLIEKLKEPKIDAGCLKELGSYAPAALEMLKILKSYNRPD